MSVRPVRCENLRDAGTRAPVKLPEISGIRNLVPGKSCFELLGVDR